MIDSILSIIAPHPCCGCGKIGSILCDYCKNDIENNYFDGCLLCGCIADDYGRCFSCSTPYERVWCVGKREDALRRIIDSHKFYNMRAAHKELAALLLTRIGSLPSSCCIVPVPTVASHIRERGYDHMALIAREMARESGARYAPLLKRRTITKQRGKNRTERFSQASQAFEVRRMTKGEVVLLVDDIVTTGATLTCGAEALIDAGAAEVWVAAIARQPLD